MRKICKQIVVFVLVCSFIFVYFPQPVSATHGFDSGPVVITVNGEAFTLYGYGGDVLAKSSFRMMDIAYILNGTRAQFDFNGYQLTRGVPYAANGTELLPITERRFALYGSYGLADSNGLVVTNHGKRTWPGGLTTTVRDVFVTAKFETDWGFGRSAVHNFDAVHDIDYLYFSLKELGRVLGFSLGHDWFTGGYVINTYEPKISEYGFAIAQDFLQNYPRYENFSYFFHDFTGSGVPVIFVHNAEVAGDSSWHYMYVYANDNFNRQGQIGSHEFFRCREGNVYLFSLVPGADDRLNIEIRSLTFSETDVKWGDVITGNESWDSGFIPALPGDKDDLTSIRPFYELHVTPPLTI